MILNTYSMETYVLLHFEHKNYIIVVVKLLCSLIMIVTSFLCSKRNRT